MPGARGPVLDPIDMDLLAAVQCAPAVPFADPVLVNEAGRVRAIARRDARAMERMLLKLAKIGRDG